MGKHKEAQNNIMAKKPRMEDDSGMEVPINNPETGDQQEEEAHSVFSIDLILKEIFHSLEFKERLTCSLVSRQWNRLAREVLRKSGKCFAAIKDVEGGERDVIKLSSVVQGMDKANSPFSGLSVHLYKRHALLMRRTHIQETENDESQSSALTLPREEANFRETPYFFSPFFYVPPPPDPFSPAVRNAVSSIQTELGPTLKYVKLTSEQMLAERHCFGSGSTYYMVSLRPNWHLSYLIMERLSPSLEGILIDFYYERDVRESFGPYPGLFLSNVRTLELECNENRVTKQDHGKIIQSLMEACNRLQNLRVDFPPCLLEPVLIRGETHQLIQQFDFTPSLKFLDKTLEFARRGPQLRKLWFTTEFDQDDVNYNYNPTIEEWSPHDQEKVRQALTELLQSSANTLEKLSMDHLDLILIVSQWDIPVLSRLKCLDLYYNYEIDAFNGFALEKINWTEHFPLLEQVSVKEAPNGRCTSLGFFVNAQVKNQTARYACLTVTTLRYKVSKTLRIRNLDLLPRLFPNVKHFHLELSGTHLQAFPQKIWTLWPDLESLSLTCFKLHLSNCDERILGVSRKDADRILGGLPGSELPGIRMVKKGIFSLLKLKRVFFGLVHGTECWPSRNSSSPEPVFLSSTALKMIRSRSPGLQIELETEVCELFKEKCHLYLKHLQPHVQSLKRVEITVKSDIHECRDPTKLGRR